MSDDKKKRELSPEMLDYIFNDIKKAMQENKILKERIKGLENNDPPSLFTFACFSMYGEIIDEGMVMALTEEEAESMVQCALKLNPMDVVELTKVESSFEIKGVFGLGDY